MPDPVLTPAPLDPAVDEGAVEAVRDALGDRRWLVLTGAGVSTDSGIPDYRSPGTPPRRPMTIAQFRAGDAARQRYWARGYLGHEQFLSAQPNDTHRMLAAREAAGGISGLITQNVDELHEKAGHRDVIDLHGVMSRVICLDCGTLSTRARLQQRLAALNPGFGADDLEVLPDGDVQLEETSTFVVAACEVCGGVLKPDVVYFGENVPKPRVEECWAKVDDAEALVVLGSSLAVMSGLRFVRGAHKRGLPIVVITRGPTRGDELASVKLETGVAPTLRALGL